MVKKLAQAAYKKLELAQSFGKKVVRTAVDPLAFAIFKIADNLNNDPYLQTTKNTKLVNIRNVLTQGLAKNGVKNQETCKKIANKFADLLIENSGTLDNLQNGFTQFETQLAQFKNEIDINAGYVKIYDQYNKFFLPHFEFDESMPIKDIIKNQKSTNGQVLNIYFEKFMALKSNPATTPAEIEKLINNFCISFNIEITPQLIQESTNAFNQDLDPANPESWITNLQNACLEDSDINLNALHKEEISKFVYNFASLIIEDPKNTFKIDEKKASKNIKIFNDILKQDKDYSDILKGLSASTLEIQEFKGLEKLENLLKSIPVPQEKEALWLESTKIAFKMAVVCLAVSAFFYITQDKIKILDKFLTGFTSQNGHGKLLHGAAQFVKAVNSALVVPVNSGVNFRNATLFSAIAVGYCKIGIEAQEYRLNDETQKQLYNLNNKLEKFSLGK